MATSPDTEKPVDATRLSDAEKDLKTESNERLAGFEDPDAGLSEEERAKIVRTSIPTISSHPIVSLSCPVLLLHVDRCRYPNLYFAFAGSQASLAA
jgi:hypothetical protein